MSIGVVGNKLDGASQMNGSFIEIAEFVQRAAQIEMRDGVIRINCERLLKGFASFLETAHLIGQAAKIDMRLEPFGAQCNHAVINADRVFGPSGIGFASDGMLEKLFRSARVHGADFLRAGEGVKWKKKLAGERFDRLSRGARRYCSNRTAAGE